MPIVFVHGVNTRIEDMNYADEILRIEGFLKSILAPRIGLDPATVAVTFPYWGGSGVKFRWNQASLPTESASVEALSLSKLGPNSADFELWLGEAHYQYGVQGINLGQLSRSKGFGTAVDLVWDTASAIVHPGNGYADIVSGYVASLAYARENPAPKWALQQSSLTNTEFIDMLVKESAPFLLSTPAVEALGLANCFQSLREAVNRLGDAPNEIATSLAIGIGRKSVHAKASRFLGDIFIYLSERGTKEAPGPILEDILMKLRKAQAEKAGDDKLVVIGHSLGGVIVYDVLTHFAPELKIDVFISVGSQVGMFEEMSLFRASQQGIPPNPPTDRLDRPDGIAKWMNIFDTNDAFSFRAQGVFKDVDDYKFDTGYGLLEAHGGYFARPSFYKRLAARLSPASA